MQRWMVHLEGGPRRVNHAAVAIDDKIYTFGGYCTGEDYDNTRPMDVHVLDTSECGGVGWGIYTLKAGRELLFRTINRQLKEL